MRRVPCVDRGRDTLVPRLRELFMRHSRAPSCPVLPKPDLRCRRSLGIEHGSNAVSEGPSFSIIPRCTANVMLDFLLITQSPAQRC